MIEHTMKTKKKTALFAAAILAVMTMPATAANLVAYYPVDSFYNTGTMVSPGISLTRPTWSLAGVTLRWITAEERSIRIQSTLPAASSWQLQAAWSNWDTAKGGTLSLGTADPFAATGSFTYALWMYTPANFYWRCPGIHSQQIHRQHRRWVVTSS